MEYVENIVYILGLLIFYENHNGGIRLLGKKGKLSIWDL